MLRVLMVLVSLLFTTLSVRAAAEDGAPLAIAGARQYDIVSRINGQIYRLMVGSPEKTGPAVTYPVFYVLDGNENFGSAIAMARRLHGCCQVPPAVVVGIGYPTDDRGEISRRRAFDLTLSLSSTANGVEYGGADAFLRVLEEELTVCGGALQGESRQADHLWAFLRRVDRPACYVSQSQRICCLQPVQPVHLVEWSRGPPR